MKLPIILFVSMSLIPFVSYAYKSPIISQAITGVMVGTTTGISLGLLHKYYPEYNRATFGLTSLLHTALLDDVHKEMQHSGIAVDISAVMAAFVWFIAINTFEANTKGS